LSADGHDLRLTAARTGTLADVAPAGLGGLGAALDSLGQNGSAANALLGRIDAQSTTEGVEQALRELAPDSGRAAQQAAQVASAAVFSALGDRMDAARSGANVAQGAARGLSAGNGTAGRGWVQGLGAWGEQKARGGANGYDLDAHGLAVGLESDRSAQEVMGLSFGLNRANADGTGVGAGDDVRVKAVSLGGYFSRNLPGMTLDVSALLGHNRYDSRRAINVGGVTDIATGDYKGWQLGGQVEAGFPFTLSPDVSGRWLVGGRANYLSTDGYDERGSSAALRMGSASARSLQSVLGAELTRAMSATSAVQLRARWLHEFADTPDVNASFVAGGPSFTTPGAQPGRDALQLGVGWNHQPARGVTLSVRYDAEVKRAYLAHQLSARATWSF
ncbi:MAG: autotransporter outer membrane beta-barrel domain-containing protein, partial [Lysobacteraceae bacterium]